MGRRGPDAVPDTREVDRQQAGDSASVKRLRGFVDPNPALFTRIVRAPKSQGDPFDGSRHRLGIGDVGAEREVSLPELAGELVGGVDVDVHDATAPSVARRWATARPMPWAPPVTTAACPARGPATPQPEP